MDFGEKTVSRGFNRATQAKRQTGSAIKPVAILAPGIEEKIFTAASIYDDTQTTFDDGSEDGYTPEDYDAYLGNITVRRAVESSQNIPFVYMMEKLTPKKAIEYLEEMGVTTLTKNDESLSLALGGLDEGMTPLEFAAAYATIANDGVYIEPTFYTKIETSSGKVAFKTTQESRRVFSEETAYVVKELLTEPVEGTYGTATYCSITGIDVAAKTGTTNDNYDRWLCGFTNYYTAVTWYGYDINETVSYNGKNPAGLIWASVMKNIHSGLEDSSFEKPSGVQVATICTKTGLLANGHCSSTVTEYFIKGTVPTSSCTIHTSNDTNSGTNTDVVQQKIQEEQEVEIEEPTETVTENTVTETENTSNTNSATSSTNTSNSTSTGNTQSTNLENQTSNTSNTTNTTNSNNTTNATSNNSITNTASNNDVTNTTNTASNNATNTTNTASNNATNTTNTNNNANTTSTSTNETATTSASESAQNVTSETSAESNESNSNSADEEH